ncbi:hypothetical protein [Jeotgalibacillus proteolyticus]|uniref:Lipoprotein n=1 Tax=Jeotgalibacillus proteolyticus TaxID=2082395 RepID=A0A2S5GCZ8_9BACL|nr:hypothetical protein [Jeotgalibacillus proteolyticus]PPA70912.1 hypothetical protein C4B60_08990 [Jeotgalibacillus proteolyticus]
MKRILCLLLLSFVLVTGCTSEERLIFSGEGDHWKAQYIADRSENDQAASGSVSYIGEEAVPDRIEYRLEYGSAGSNGDVPLKDGAANLNRSSCGNCSVLQKDSEILVTITWEGKTEEFLLSSE